MSMHRTLNRSHLGMIVLAFSLSCFAGSNPPVLTPMEAGSQPKANAAQDNEKPEPDKRGTKALPMVIEIGPSSAIKVETTDKTEKYHGYFSYEWWLVYLTGAMAFITFFLALYTGKLYRATVGLGREAKATSDRQGIEMRTSLAIAEKSAATATRTVETMEDTAERQLRAYIFSTHDGPMTIDPNGALFATITIKNYGQTPANEVQCHVFIGLQRLPLDVRLDPPDYAGGSKSPLAPGETIKQFPTLPRPLKQAEIEAIRNNEGAIFIWGEIAYVDIFKKHRRTRFRLYSTGEDFTRGELGNLTPGIISALTGLGNNTSQIQITAPIQPGSSGSPVLNKKGEVVGVVSMKLSDSKMAKATGQVGQNVNFAVSGQTLKSFLDAHKIEYSKGGFMPFDKSTADLADEAKKWTTVVECWK